MKINKLVIFLIVIWTSSLNGQSFLQKITSNSEVIIEGEVISQSLYEYKGKSYTISNVKITKQLKGEVPIEIQLLSPVYEEFKKSIGIQYVEKNDFGVFFLNKIETGHFILTDGLHGFIKYFEYGEEPKAYSKRFEINNIYNDLIFPIYQQTGVNKTLQANRHEQKIISLSLDEDCLEYYIHNLRITNISSLSTAVSNYWFEFDISARFLGSNPIEIGKSEITFKYSPNIFGQNVHSSGNLVLNKSNEFNDYILNVSDLSESKIKITLQKNQITNTISNFYTKLFRAKIRIDNFNLNDILALSVDENFDLKTYEVDNGIIKKINCNIFNEDVNGEVGTFFAPVIESITETRLPAGTREVHSKLEIIGSNFGTSQENSEIWLKAVNIPDVVPLPGDYEFWSDTKIIAYVPSNGAMPGSTTTGANHYIASTGAVKIVSGPMSSNEVNITVPYAVTNDWVVFQGEKTGQPIFLDDKNGSGGYTVYFTSEFASLPNTSQGVSIQNAFNEAVNQWCSITGLNLKINTTQTVSTIWCSNDIRVGVDFSSTNPHATAFHNNSSITVPEIDVPCDLLGCAEIEINPNTIDNYSFNEVVNTFLHEIGHAHLLTHVTDFDDLMNIFGGTTLSITPDAQEGSVYIQNKSEELNYSRSDCITSTKEYDNKELQFSIFMNQNEINLNWDSNWRIESLRIFDISGRNVFEDRINHMNHYSANINLSSGVYIIQLKNSNGLTSSKLFYNAK